MSKRPWIPCAGVAVLIASSFMRGGGAAEVRAQEEIAAPADAPRAPRCGKAEAARRLMGEPAEELPLAYLESMTDTNILHYAINIEVTNLNPSNNTCTITGSNTMTIKSRSASLSEFRFRLRNQFNITGAYVNGSTPVTAVTESTSTRRVTLNRTYGLDEVFTLTIQYTGDTVSAAFGSIEVTIHSGGIPIVATLSEPYYAYTWWPVKDGDVFLPGDNSDKATLDFWITVASNFTVVSNGLLQGTDVLSGNRKRYRWASSYPISTYLVSFSATQYNHWTGTYTHPTGSMPVEFYIYPSNDTSGNRLAWEKVISMLGTYRPLFGEYPFIDEKYGLYNFPFGGGMEHQTITGQSGFDEWLTAHELAHQWWGDAITCKTWNHIWLNEGFASYAEALWEEHKPGSSGLPALKNAMVGMRYTGTGSVYVYDDEVDDLWEIFNGSTSYNKGAWVLHMLRHVLGDDNFFAALAAYRAAYEGLAATTEDFQAVCETFYPGGDLGWFFSEWVYGELAPAYAWGWSTAQVNGRAYLLVHVDQTQSAGYQRFTMPIDVVADGSTHVILNDADPEHFVIPVPAAPSAVSFDPDAWILWSTRTQQTYVPGPPRIVETSPAPGELVSVHEELQTVTVTFHTAVNATAGHFSLGGDRTGAVPFTISSGSGVNPVVLNLSSPLLADAYTLTVTSGVVASNSGLQLDGEVSDPMSPESLPSGNGQPGGNATIRFAVSLTIPAASAWGLTIMAALVAVAGTVIMRGDLRRQICRPSP